MAKHPWIDALVKEYLAVGMKERGFTKKNLVWTRKVGKTLQVVELQKSHGGTGEMYVNLGIVLDEIDALGGDGIGNLSVGGHGVHVGGRLHDYAPRETPHSWRPAERTYKAMGSRIQALLFARLDRWAKLDGAKSVAKAEKVTPRDGLLAAQFAWVTGDKPRARKIAEAFRKRSRVNVDAAEIEEWTGIKL